MRLLCAIAVFLVFVHGLSAADRSTTLGEKPQGTSNIINTILPEPYGPLQNIYFTPPAEQWLTGYSAGLGYFYGGGSYGIDFGTGWGGSKLDPVAQPDSFPNVEIRFSTTVIQKAYRYQRGGDNNWGYEGYDEVPFTAWDTDHNRQLNVAFIEWTESSVFDSTWNPSDDEIESGGREYLYIFASDYSGEDPMNSAICYPCNSILWNNGDLDILYVLWPILKSGHSMSELADGHSLVFSKIAVRPQYEFFSPGRNESSGNTMDGLRVKFDRELDAATLTENSFFVHGDLHGRLQGAISFVTQTNEAVFVPAVSASAGERITATIKSDVRSTEGHEIGRDYYWSFFNRTEDAPGKFGEPVVYSAGDSPNRVVAAFINNDNYADIIVLNINSNNFYVFFGNGDGTLDTPVSYPTFQYPVDLCVADFNGDSYNDVAVADTSGNDVCLYTNNGTGILALSSSIDMNGRPVVIVPGDLDADNDIDLTIAAWETSENRVYILLNDGTGQFAPHWYAESYEVGNSPRDICIADIDNDNDADVVVTGLNSVEILDGWGDGTFTDYVDIIVPELMCRDVTIADYDNDGFNDIAVNHFWDGVVRVHKGSGEIQGFTQQHSYSFGEPTPELMVGDIDSDGKLDLVAAVMGSRLEVLSNQGGCIFSSDSTYAVGEPCSAGALVDLDNDSDLDAVIARGNSDDMAVLLNDQATAVTDDHEIQPRRFILNQNYPNPFNPSTTIDFDLPRPSNVTIGIYNSLGQKVRQLVNRRLPAGSHRITWDGSSSEGELLATGVYFYRIVADGFADTKKMLLLK